MMEEMNEKSYKNEVQGILEEIQNADLTISNYRRYYERLRSTEQIILAQIENNVSEYSDLMSRYKEAIVKSSFKDGYDSGIVSVDMFELIKTMNKKLQDTYSWKTLQQEINNAMLKKMQDVMGETSALEIKRDSLKEMREDTERRNKMFLDSQKENNDLLKNLMTARHQLMEDKMNLFMSTVSKDIDEKVKQMHEMLTIFGEKMDQPVPPAMMKFMDRFEEQVKHLESKYAVQEPKVKEEETEEDLEKKEDIKKLEDWQDAQKKIDNVQSIPSDIEKLPEDGDD